MKDKKKTGAKEGKSNKTIPEASGKINSHLKVFWSKCYLWTIGIMSAKS